MLPSHFASGQRVLKYTSGGVFRRTDTSGTKAAGFRNSLYGLEVIGQAK
jgi:hypothetical protein